MTQEWYIIHTYSGFENRVVESLKNRIQAFGLSDFFGEIMIPTENVVEMRQGKKHISSKKFFPGYVLVQMDLRDETLQVVRNTPKVTGFLGGDRPEPLTRDEIDRILGQMSEAKQTLKPKFHYESGEKVKIIDGPFASFQGVVDATNQERNTLTVMVTIFGRATPVELNYLQVEKA